MTDTSGDTVTVTGAAKAKTTAGPYALNMPRCCVDIYLFEGGMYSLTSYPLLGVSVSKAINGDIQGSFQIQLPPSGPRGPDTPPYWSEIITPFSLVVIGMSRGAKQAIVMVGLVTSVSEQQVWSNEAVRRAIVVDGKDFGRYFALSSYYTLWYLATTGNALPSGGGATAVASAAFPPGLAGSLAQGRPDQMAHDWYTYPMAGGALATTYAPYKGAHVLFSSAMATLFEIFHAKTPNAFAAQMLTTDNAWVDKFREILPYPWFEFFVITAPPGFYQTQPAESYGAASAGTEFSCMGLGPDVTASPTLVARVNPVPDLKATNGNEAPSFTGLDATAWARLPVFTLEGYGFLGSTVGFDESAILNYFAINPSSMITKYGQSNALTTQYLFAFAAVGDPASIQRYGFRPARGDISWLADPDGVLANQGGINDSDFIAALMARFCSAYSPMALMARATVTTFLRPDIMPGCVFRYQPYKFDSTWDFYVEGVAHNFEFGGRSTTTLSLSRGLPSTVYADQSDSGMLFNVHIGNAERINGTYQAMLPAGSPPSLRGIPQGQLQAFFQSLAKVGQTAQATQTP